MGRVVRAAGAAGLLAVWLVCAPSTWADDGDTSGFSRWKAEFRSKAIQASISPSLYDRAMQGVTLDPKVIQADRNQPEFTRPVWEYLDSAVSEQRVQNGLRQMRDRDSLLRGLKADYSVSPEAVVAIWGLESAYGQNMGSFSLVRSLATLAYDGRRPRFGEEQLIAALRIVQAGDMPLSHLKGSWAGGIGHTQFIPTTYLHYAVDGDGDGHRNLRDSVPDALASTASYLRHSGWRANQPWGYAVRLPVGFDLCQVDTAYRKPVQQWTALGVRLANGSALTGPVLDEASILLPAGAGGPVFLVFDNFRTILKYNNSTSYALAVGMLADRLAGQAAPHYAWPRQALPLRRTERIELQELLAMRGFDPGTADGVIGANTRQAMRSYQKSRGLPCDAFPSRILLKSLRENPVR